LHRLIWPGSVPYASTNSKTGSTGRLRGLGLDYHMISYVVLRWFEESQLEILSTVSLAEAVASLGSTRDVIRVVEDGNPRPLTAEEEDRADGIFNSEYLREFYGR
jgi:hypothetical protein